jgi:hypothetical protein
MTRFDRFSQGRLQLGVGECQKTHENTSRHSNDHQNKGTKGGLKTPWTGKARVAVFSRPSTTSQRGLGHGDAMLWDVCLCEN